MMRLTNYSQLDRQLNDFEKRLKELETYYDDNNLDDMMKESLDIIMNEVQSRTPRSEYGGKHLRDMYSNEKATSLTGTYNSIVVAPGGFYWKFLEYGFHHVKSGKRIPGKAFVQNSVIATEKQVNKIFDDALKRKLNN